MSDDQTTQSACGCCEANSLTPITLENLPGLSALAYRVGTHGSFKAAMLKALSRQASSQELTTRADSDPAIALLDAWSSVLDVLTFYQERIVNEGFLRTATERYSVRELARAIGYQLNPGMAAETSLVFTVDDSVDKVTIDTGTKAQSVPGPGEQAQTFETIEKIEARAEWNIFTPKMTIPLPATTVELGQTDLYLQGANLQLQPGDAILVVGDERNDTGSEQWDVRFLDTVTPYPEKGFTHVTWKEFLGYQKEGKKTVYPAAENVKVFVFRQRAALFGNNAPDWKAMSNTKSVQDQYPDKTPPDTQNSNWPLTWFNNRTAPYSMIDLDAAYPKILPDSWLALLKPGQYDMYTKLYRVKSVAFESRAEFAISGKITRIQLDTYLNLANFGLRETLVLAQSEPLTIVEAPYDSRSVIENDMMIPVIQKFDSPAPGRRLLVSGIDSGSGDRVGEPATLKNISYDENGCPTIDLAGKLQHSYLRASVQVYGNVVQATHGATRKEVLGSGDASQLNRKFTLKQTPLTYIQKPTPTGSSSTLALSVGGIQWEEVPSLYDLGARDRAFTLRMAEDGTASVQFGDGIKGERLPTGIENVTATYRVGTGMAGQVKARQLSLLMGATLGVRAVNNPIEATGAADPETLNSARQNAPRTVLTLDRIVSLKDFEDFARGFSNISKAQAIWLWQGKKRIIHITVAGPGGNPVDDTVLENLRDAIDAVRDPTQAVRIDSIDPQKPYLFDITADFWTMPEYSQDMVQQAIKDELKNAFSFERRIFGQGVTEAQVLAVMQSAEGVLGAGLRSLRLDTTQPLTVLQSFANQALCASQAVWEWDETEKIWRIFPAQILALNPNPEGVTLFYLEQS